MARKRRERNRGITPRPGTMPANPGWRWRSVPVVVALCGGFVAGWYVAAIGAPAAPGQIATIVMYVFLFGFALSLSRVTRYWTERWMSRRRQRTLTATEPGADRLSKRRR